MKGIGRALALAIAAITTAFPAPALATEPDIKTLCFFSLNNPREYSIASDFLEGLPANVRTIEFHWPGDEDRPEQSFSDMVASSPPCDGLVISGHHTGSFGGHRANGVLRIDLLETLSCDPEYDRFFRGVKALWLQGCRTLGVGEMAPGGTEMEADYHMQRVGAELARDGLQQSFADLSLEFSVALDEDNPLSSRYQRVFPAATVFGWTRNSPGVLVGSERSLPYHIAHMVQVEQGAPLFDPFGRPSRKLRSGMSEGIWNTLDGDRAYAAIARQAWVNHGRVNQSGLGFLNPDLKAYPPLIQGSSGDLLEARAAGCELRAASSDEVILRRVILNLLENPYYLAHNFDALLEAIDLYRGNPDYESLRLQLADSASLMGLLDSKLHSSRTGLLAKMAYYNLYRELRQGRSTEIESKILNHVSHFLLASDLSGTAYDIRDFRESLLVSVARYQLADAAYYQSLVQSPAASAGTLSALAWSFVQQTPPEAASLARQIILQPQVDATALRGLALWILNDHPEATPGLMAQILGSQGLDGATLETLAATMVKYPLPNDADLAQGLVAHPKTNRFSLASTSLAIRRHNIQVGQDLLLDIADHEHADRSTRENAAAVLERQATADERPTPEH